jgi:membrane protein YqaA with SNARE-associated domain
MHLITPGRIKIDSKAKNGQLLLTDQSIFVLESAATGSSTGGALGGLVGYFIGRYFDRRKAKRNLPEHLQDLEIAGLEDKVRDGLLTTKLIVKLPLNQSLQIKPTRLGFQFTAAGQPCVTYAGWVHKKKLLRFFADHGAHVDVA